jgi:hypothetical protein
MDNSGSLLRIVGPAITTYGQILSACLFIYHYKPIFNSSHTNYFGLAQPFLCAKESL